MDFSGYLSNVKVNLTFSSNFVHTLKSSNSANEIPIHSNPLDAMTYAHLVFAFFDSFKFILEIIRVRDIRPCLF